jgi:hypothetical protein
MNHRSLRALASLTAAALSALWLGGCVVAARPQAVYGNYGYATVAQPNTVYYSGGNYGGTYYQPGYYARSAPFIASTGYVQGGYVQPGVVVQPQQPVYYQQQPQQPVYYQQRPGVVVSGQVQAPVFNGGGTVIVR